MQKLSSFGQGKKFRPKKSLTSLLHAALQLLIKMQRAIIFRFPVREVYILVVQRDAKKR